MTATASARTDPRPSLDDITADVLAGLSATPRRS